MSTELPDRVGFDRPLESGVPCARRSSPCASLVAMLVIAVTLAIALLTMTIGIARAQTLGMMAEADGGWLGIATTVSMMLLALAGVTALLTRVATGFAPRG